MRVMPERYASRIIGNLKSMRTISALSGIFGAVIERAFASYKLVVAYRTLRDIAARHKEFAHKNPAIVARYGGGLPVAMFVATADSGNVATFQCKGHNLLRGDDSLRPYFNHRYAPVEDSLWLVMSGRALITPNLSDQLPHGLAETTPIHKRKTVRGADICAATVTRSGGRQGG